MKKNLFLSLITGLMVTILAACAGAGEEVWLTDFEEAKQLAAEENKAILVNFSGSDWCTWCIRLSDEVLKQEAFTKYAKKNLILFVADFPRNTEIPEDVAAQNKELVEKYGIQGFPTILLLDADGKLIGRSGYQEGGPELYVEHLKELIKPKV